MKGWWGAAGCRGIDQEGEEGAELLMGLRLPGGQATPHPLAGESLTVLVDAHPPPPPMASPQKTRWSQLSGGQTFGPVLLIFG